MYSLLLLKILVQKNDGVDNLVTSNITDYTSSEEEEDKMKEQESSIFHRHDSPR